MERRAADKDKLEALIRASNVADDLSESELQKISSNVVDYYDADAGDPAYLAKKKKWESGKKLVDQSVEAKTNLRAGMNSASNMKYPLMTVAAIQFSSRALPGLVPDQDVAKPKLYGKLDGEKLKQAEEVCRFINWQLFNEIEEWEEDTDRLLLMLPLYGSMFRKVYFSEEKGRVCTDILTPEQLVMPYKSKSVKDASRATEEFTLSPREIERRVRSGMFLDVDYAISDPDAELPEEFILQCCWLDLDEDGFKEPYMVSVHKNTRQVVRISANYREEGITINEKEEVVAIRPVQYYVKYSFIPAIDGGIYDLGFFDLLHPINEAVNTVMNQLIDAGTLANSNTGFISKDFPCATHPRWRLVSVGASACKSGIARLNPSRVQHCGVRVFH